MYRSTTLIAGIACTQALHIEAQTEAEWGFFEDIGNAFNDAGNWFGGAVDDVGDFFVEDVGGAFADAGNWLDDAFGDAIDFFDDSFSDAGNWIEGAANDFAGGIEDAWNWVSNPSNWEAFGKTIAGGTVALL